VRPKALLFDLGGVLIDIDFDLAFQAWSRHSSLPLAALRQRLLFDEPYERHERGEIVAHEYFAHLASSLQLTATPDEIATGWNAIFRGEIAPTLDRVARARRTLPCYVLTNTNATHMACWAARFPSVATGFDRIFASHEIGLRKPERAVFDHVCRETGVAPQSLLFFDDTPANVDAAASYGLPSVLVRGPADVARALRTAGL
jgi:putative hydrolase of the HAD superfamily